MRPVRMNWGIVGRRQRLRTPTFRHQLTTDGHQLLLGALQFHLATFQIGSLVVCHVKRNDWKVDFGPWDRQRKKEIKLPNCWTAVRCRSLERSNAPQEIPDDPPTTPGANSSTEPLTILRGNDSSTRQSLGGIQKWPAGWWTILDGQPAIVLCQDYELDE